MKKHLIALSAGWLLAFAAQAAPFDCVPTSPTQLRAGGNEQGNWLSWPCVVDNGYAYAWNQVVWQKGYLTDVTAIRQALASPEPLAALNQLMAGNTCASSPTVQGLCDAATKAQASYVLPALYVSRPVSWGGVAVYKLTNGIADTSKVYTVVGLITCKCGVWRGKSYSGALMCLTYEKDGVQGASFCEKNE